ncbi:hypothetical protein [Blastomonas sp.]|uniref:hypothetical protein n=1 Tax=Blastomonas sp. TaxID=1909299 RepID=UPI00391C9A1A
MIEPTRGPGWDKQAVNRIAKDHYGSLDKMFQAHGWTLDGRVISQIAPTKVVQTYGSIAAFERAHENGLAGNAMLNPVAAIESEPPDVWLTSYYGYDPENWGLLAFTKPEDRDKFLRESKPGALVVIYGTKDLGTDEAGLVLGVQQVSHFVGAAKDFIAPGHWADKEKASPDKWNLGVRCVRAWEIPLEYRPTVDEFAPDTYSIANARTIGRRGKQLSAAEARQLLALPMFEIPVYGGMPVDVSPPKTGLAVFTPSKPGPVSQQPYMVPEAEGPKHLYILRLRGKVKHFVEDDLDGRDIVKIGFSVSPDTRMQAFNAALPGNQFEWEVYRSTFAEGQPPFESSKPALEGERGMKEYLLDNGASLGREFFVAGPKKIEKAWQAALQAARNWKA